MNRTFGMLLFLLVVEASAAPNKMLDSVSFDQNLNAQIPLALEFKDEHGQAVSLKNYFSDKPVILSLVYYDCPMLCTETLNGMVRVLRSLKWNVGDQFNVLTVSFNPRDTSALALAKKNSYGNRYGRAGAATGWTFLTGDEDNIEKLTNAVGFHYVYDSKADQYAHSTGILVVTPQGKVSRYLYGVEYSARDLRLALVDSVNGKIGSPVDRILLYCYHYDPLTGTYGVRVMRVLRVAAFFTVIFVLFLAGALTVWPRGA